MKGWTKPPYRVGEGKKRSPQPAVVHETTAITSSVIYIWQLVAQNMKRELPHIWQ